MPRAQCLKPAEDAARKLSSLVCSPKVVHLLQQPLPAQLAAAHQAVIASCSIGLQQLFQALPTLPASHASGGTAAVLQSLRGVLRHQAAHSAGVLLAWLQQQPQRLAAALHKRRNDQLQPNTIEGLWFVGMDVMCKLAAFLVCCTMEDASSVAELTLDMTQQVQQTGGCTCLTF
jgi:hypothetical protein